MATWIIGSIVIAAMVFAGYHSFKKSKNGDCGCGYGCGGCDACSPAAKKNMK